MSALFFGSYKALIQVWISPTGFNEANPNPSPLRGTAQLAGMKPLWAAIRNDLKALKIISTGER